MTDKLIQLVAKAYWASSRLEPPSSISKNQGFAMWEAVEKMMEIPELRTELVLLLARDATTEVRQAYLAAGPLAELIDIADDGELACIIESLYQVNVADTLHRVRPPEEPIREEWLRKVSATMTELGHQKPFRALQNSVRKPTTQ